MPDGPLILAVDLRNTPKGGGYGPTHCFIYIDGCNVAGEEHFTGSSEKSEGGGDNSSGDDGSY